MEDLMRELNLEEMESNEAGDGYTKGQCLSFLAQCASGGNLGCGGDVKFWCDLYRDYC